MVSLPPFIPTELPSPVHPGGIRPQEGVRVLQKLGTQLTLRASEEQAREAQYG